MFSRNRWLVRLLLVIFISVTLGCLYYASTLSPHEYRNPNRPPENQLPEREVDGTFMTSTPEFQYSVPNVITHSNVVTSENYILTQSNTSAGAEVLQSSVDFLQDLCPSSTVTQGFPQGRYVTLDYGNQRYVGEKYYFPFGYVNSGEITWPYEASDDISYYRLITLDGILHIVVPRENQEWHFDIPTYPLLIVTLDVPSIDSLYRYATFTLTDDRCDGYAIYYADLSNGDFTFKGLVPGD